MTVQLAAASALAAAQGAAAIVQRSGPAGRGGALLGPRLIEAHAAALIRRMQRQAAASADRGKRQRRRDKHALSQLAAELADMEASSSEGMVETESESWEGSESAG